MYALHLAGDGKRMATGSTDGRAIVWDLESGQPLYVLEGHAGSVGDLRFSPDGRTLATRDGGSVRLWDADTGRPLRRIESEVGLSALAWSADGQSVLAGRKDGRIQAWKAADGSPGALIDVGGGAIGDLAVGPIFAAAGPEGAVWWRNPAAGMHRLKGHEGRVFKVALHPDGRRLVTAGADETIRIWPISAP